MHNTLPNSSLVSYSAVVTRYSTLSRIAPIAEDQWGLITRRQAEGAGVSQATLQRLAKTGILDRVAHGVIAQPGGSRLITSTFVRRGSSSPRRFRGGSGHRNRGSHPTVQPRCCTVLATRPQTGTSSRCRSGCTPRRSDIRLHHREVALTSGSFFTGCRSRKPSRIAADLLGDKEDPGLCTGYRRCPARRPRLPRRVRGRSCAVRRQFRAQTRGWPGAPSLAPRHGWRPASIPVDSGGESAGHGSAEKDGKPSARPQAGSRGR